MSDELYPVSPQINNLSLLKSSSKFKYSVFLVLVSIFIFFVFYLLLLAIALALLIGCFFAGITIISFRPNFITLAIGLGLIVLGIMFFIFLVKFIFAKNKFENLYQKEITETDQPLFFNFLKKLSEETNIKFPNKVFVTPDVNAGVFFNSSFLSMFFPVDKNLEIGLGLVNALNVSEFKAVIAHEFGHFSQKSMKVGSYIYTVNRAIYNMVNEHDNWDKLLSKWVSVGGLFGLFALITFWLVERIRSLLGIAYKLINFNYLKLSRAMEFNADSISASLAGSQTCINALRKLDFTAEAYNHTLDVLNLFVENGKSSKNIYPNHTFMINCIGKHYSILFNQGLPLINDEIIKKHFIKSRITIRDQWASHPSLKERERNLMKLNLNSEVNTKPAWNLFSNVERIQSDISNQLYNLGFPGKKFSFLNEKEFEEHVLTEEKKYMISLKYNGFYNNRNICEYDVEELVKSDAIDQELKFEQIYNESNSIKIKSFIANKNDSELLEQIAEEKIKIKYFEFDSVQYKKKGVFNIREKLEKELSEQQKYIFELDQKSFLLNYQLSRQRNSDEEYLKKYKSVITRQKLLTELKEYKMRFQNLSSELYSKSRWSENQLTQFAEGVLHFEEKFRSYLKINDIKYYISKLSSSKQKTAINDFTKSKSGYFKASQFEEEKFLKLSEVVFIISTSFEKAYSESLKELTEFQLELNNHLN